MDYNNRLLRGIGLDPNNAKGIKLFCKKVGINYVDLKFYNEKNILPTGSDLDKILEASKISILELKLSLGLIDQKLKEQIARNAAEIAKFLQKKDEQKDQFREHKKAFITHFGTMYQGDCLSLLKEMESETVDLVFADPPFNLDKFYPSEMDDNLREIEYLKWCENWMVECARILKKGGSFFLWNLPKWNTSLSEILNSYLNFRHWIATDIKFSLPIQNRLYPSHYSLLYYVKGEKPNTFHPDRMAMEVCPKCHGDLKDYGGYKSKMNPKGVNLTDVWYDIPPVRHRKYKKRKDANELSIKLLDRIIELSTNPGDLVFDPFGGAGTTYAVAEIKERKWIGIELGPVDQIEARLSDMTAEKKLLNKYRAEYNSLFPDKIKHERRKKGLWTTETFEVDKKKKADDILIQGELFSERMNGK